MADLDTLVAALDTHGLLLLQDKTLPSVVGLLAGAPVRGSWWAHPKAHQMFACLTQLHHRRDATAVYLVDGKVTFVHRRLWPALLAVATSGEPWQTRGMSQAARALLQRVERERTVEAVGPAARQLQERLLVHGEEEHTEAGSHAHVLRTWEEWRSLHAVPGGTGMKAFEGELQLDAALKKIGGNVAALPWHKSKRVRIDR